MAGARKTYRFTFGPWNISAGSDPFGPPVREEVEDAESYTYSSDRGAEPAAEEPDRKRKRRPRRRRAKPDAIAARMKGSPAEGPAEGGTEPEAAAPE